MHLSPTSKLGYLSFKTYVILYTVIEVIIMKYTCRIMLCQTSILLFDEQCTFAKSIPNMFSE